MGISRRRTAAVGCAFVLVGVTGVGTATAAPRPATPMLPPATPTPAPPAMQRTSASVAAPALAATATARSRLALSVGRGSTLVVVGVLTRASNGTPLPRRVVDVYVRTADTGTWRLATTVRTSSSGRAVYWLPDRPRLHIPPRVGGHQPLHARRERDHRPGSVRDRDAARPGPGAGLGEGGGA